MWLHIISDDTGNTPDALYSYFCEKYLPWNLELVFGNEVRKTSGSSGMDTKEFSLFLDKIHLEMSELGIYLPFPQDVGFEEAYVRYSTKQ